MFLQFIGVNEKILNLNCVAMIEDLTDENESKAVITTSDGAQIASRVTGSNAETPLGDHSMVVNGTVAAAMTPP